jgi:hypothetical protein
MEHTSYAGCTEAKNTKPIHSNQCMHTTWYTCKRTHMHASINPFYLFFRNQENMNLLITGSLIITFVKRTAKHRQNILIHAFTQPGEMPLVTLILPLLPQYPKYQVPMLWYMSKFRIRCVVKKCCHYQKRYCQFIWYDRTVFIYLQNCSHWKVNPWRVVGSLADISNDTDPLVP